MKGGRFRLAADDFAFVEEALKLSFGSFRAVGSVANIAHFGVVALLAEVTTDGALSSFLGISRPEEVTHAGDDVFSAESKSDDR